MEKSKIMEGLFARLTDLEKWRKEEVPKRKKKEKEDEEVCPNCGGDLLAVEDGIVYCSKCKEYFEEEKEDGK